VLNSVAAGRRQARSLVVAQAAGAFAAALVFLVQGPEAALGALTGGGSVALGSALMARRAFAGGVSGAGPVLMRLFGGLALKWLVIVAALYLALARFELPPLPVIAGLCAALVASLLAFRIKS
jgi:F0F1-type ATP synthase assembly protein I